MADRKITPLLGDYAENDRIQNLGNAVYIRLFTPLGSWWADVSLGSRLHELEREKDLHRVRILAKQYAQDALAPLVKSRRARRVSVSVHSPEKNQSGAGRCLLLIEVEDATGDIAAYSYPVRVS